MLVNYLKYVLLMVMVFGHMASLVMVVSDDFAPICVEFEMEEDGEEEQEGEKEASKKSFFYALSLYPKSLSSLSENPSGACWRDGSRNLFDVPTEPPELRG